MCVGVTGRRGQGMLARRRNLNFKYSRELLEGFKQETAGTDKYV